MSVPLALGGLAMIVSNVRMLLTRPPQLRATSDGVAFAGGALIAWREISGIYEASTRVREWGDTLLSRGITFTFHRKRTVLRLPSSLWLTTMAVGDVRISTRAADGLPVALVCTLDAMRRQACGEENRVVPGTSDVPPARVVRRPS